MKVVDDAGKRDSICLFISSIHRLTIEKTLLFPAASLNFVSMKVQIGRSEISSTAQV